MGPETVSPQHLPTPQLVWSAQDSSQSKRLRRRAVTVPGTLLGFLVFLALLVPAMVIGFLIDLSLKRRWPTVRVALYAVWWAGLETFGVLGAGFLWLRFAPSRRLQSDPSFRAHSRLQRWWATGLVRGAKCLLDLRFQLDDPSPLSRDGPLIVLARHGSQGDALLVAAMLSSSGLRPRFVLKRQLLWDPCLDIVGHRIPNYFVDRDTANNHDEILNIGHLAEDLSPDEAIVIFPEGTRFSQAKLNRSIKALAATAPERLPQAKRLCRVLPIRTAGVLAALRRAPSTDLLFLNHVGVSDFRTLSDLWRNVPFKTPLRFAAQRIERSAVPKSDNETDLVGWLDARWVEFDTWVATHSAYLD